LLRSLLSPVVVLLALGVAACSGDAGPTPKGEPSPFAGCDGLVVAPSASGAVTTGAASVPVAQLPDLRLPCFTGGREIRLAELRGPAVINLWASWCPPCREELPAMQRLADATAGRLHVLTVDSGDSRDAAASFAADEKVSLPTLFDRDTRLGAALGRPAVPVTVFLDASGTQHVYNAVPPDDAQLAELVRTHTGVTVTP
jgi:thiol-disulfide isomerase/thioredoxin